MTAVPDITLNNGQRIPQFGYGVYQVEPEDTVKATTVALDAGYRHIDTAQMYGNEREVGEAVAAHEVDRADVFITSKLSNSRHLPDEARASFDQTLAALGSDYVDLFLIHWPLPGKYDGDFVSTWQVLEEFYRDGRARSIGVSNFTVHHLRRLQHETTVVPAVNQIEVHPYLVQDELRGFCAEHGIAVEAWSPIAQGKVLRDPVITEIADRIGRSPAQVVLRWHVQRGDIVFPKSATPSRVAENIDIFDLELSGEDMAAVTSLNVDERIGPDPDHFNWIPKTR